MADYSLTGSRWPGNTVTWSLATGTLPADAGSPFSSTIAAGSPYAGLASRAFARWASVANLRFVQVADSAAANIRVGFGRFTGGEIGMTSWRSSGATMRPDTVVRIEDPAAMPVAPNANGSLAYSGYATQVFQVLVHEIGHALGLDHSTDRNAVMYFSGGTPNYDLDASDIAGIRAIYGTAPHQTSDVGTGYVVQIAGGQAATVRDAWTGDLAKVLAPAAAGRIAFVGGHTYGLTLDAAKGLGLDPARLRDYDGNDLGAAEGWRLNGLAATRTDGPLGYVLTNGATGRWAEVAPQADGTINMASFGAGGDTRVVGLYEDPLVKSGQVVRWSALDSQMRFQDDLAAGVLQVLGGADWDADGSLDLFWKHTNHLPDHSDDVYLRAIMHADGNIQYANYMDAAQFQGWMDRNLVPHAVYDGWKAV